MLDSVTGRRENMINKFNYPWPIFNGWRRTVNHVICMYEKMNINRTNYLGVMLRMDKLFKHISYWWWWTTVWGSLGEWELLKMNSPFVLDSLPSLHHWWLAVMCGSVLLFKLIDVITKSKIDYVISAYSFFFHYTWANTRFSNSIQRIYHWNAAI